MAMALPFFSGTAFRSVGAHIRANGVAARVGSLDQVRSFAAAAAATATNKSKSKSNKPEQEGYFDSKRAAKERRRALYEARQERSGSIKNRRAGRPRDEKRVEFRQWFIQRKVTEEYMERKARQAGLGWNYQVAVILERPAVVLPDMEAWEEDYANLEAQLAQFGKIYPKEFMPQEDFDEDMEPAPLATTMDELLQYLPKGYVPAPRETEADASGDVRTTNRKLKSSIYLALQQGGAWQLPTAKIQDDETLMDAAKRAMETHVGSQLEFWCPSNAPFAVNMAAAGDDETSAVYGTKTFFVNVQYDEGDVVETALKAEDFAWLDRFEMTERIGSEQGDDMARLYHYML